MNLAGPPAERARSLIGCRFRPQGRDPATGLDCVGLVVAAFAIPSDRVPRNYRLRAPHGPELERGLAQYFSRVAPPRMAPGDVLLFEIGGCQPHLAVRTDTGFVHADARLGRIVETPGEADWPIVAVFRSLEGNEQEAT